MRLLVVPTDTHRFSPDRPRSEASRNPRPGPRSMRQKLSAVGVEITGPAHGSGKEAARMHCPYCRNTDTRVLDSRVADDGSAIRRRRTCQECGKRFSTVEQMQLTVLKRSGTTEPFDRSKAIAGVRKACKGRPVTEDDLARLGQAAEDALRSEGWAEVPANEVGLAILGPLRQLDEVAY